MRRRHLFRPLDRYVLSEFWKIFTMTALGFPLLIIIIDLTDNLDKYLNRQLPRSQIALSYLYFIPDSMFLVMPAAVLFATVFSIGAWREFFLLEEVRAPVVRDGYELAEGDRQSRGEDRAHEDGEREPIEADARCFRGGDLGMPR